MWVHLPPTTRKPCGFPPGLARYCPTIAPALLMPPTVVSSAPGTLTVLNLKVNVGALAAVAAIMNISTNPDASTNVLQAFIGFPLGRFASGTLPPRVSFLDGRTATDSTPYRRVAIFGESPQRHRVTENFFAYFFSVSRW